MKNRIISGDLFPLLILSVAFTLGRNLSELFMPVEVPAIVQIISAVTACIWAYVLYALITSHNAESTGEKEE